MCIRDRLQTIHRQSELMVSIVNELLDLARIEARRGLDLEPVSYTHLTLPTSDLV